MTEEVQCGVKGTMTDLFYMYIQHIVLLVSIFKILCSFQLYVHFNWPVILCS